MQSSNSHVMLLGEANFNEELHQAVAGVAQKSLGLLAVGFFCAKDNAAKLFKIKSKALNKEILFVACRKLVCGFFFFLKRC